MNMHKLNLLFALATLPFVLQPGAGNCAAAPAPVVAPASAPVVMDHISITSMGSGSPVVLIPGLSSPRAVWDGVVPELAKRHRVILVQVNGFGGDAPGKNLAPGILAGLVAELDGYIVREKLGQPVIVGHSMGGLAALMFAHAHPDHVSRVMVVDALPFIAVLFVPTATVAMVEPQAGAIRDQMAAGFGKPADAANAEATANRLALKPESRAKVKAWVIASDPRVSGEALYEDMTTDLRPELARIATPITLVYPWNATGPTKEMAEPLYRGAYAGTPHITFVDVADSAHFVMLDQPAAFQAALMAFVGK
ncbi:MAG: alpha/beta hydrolase [Sphingomonas bacterium]|uniref:alpha/beta fold hydrolase n=1 Tax=Sphingomonas bacterium TaxID=1895847 RepID=UPI00262C3903|nr:alpha/beta hydrolase [Sphingomonas bacterium]MDB5710129.1 alpha/beta hydrolase [Sphingomonas bacterium]